MAKLIGNIDEYLNCTQLVKDCVGGFREYQTFRDKDGNIDRVSQLLVNDPKADERLVKVIKANYPGPMCDGLIYTGAHFPEKYIRLLDKEIKLLQRAKKILENKKFQRIDTIKDCYQQKLCPSKLTGNKYQVTIADHSQKVEDNFDHWDSVEIAKYGLEKTTIIRRLSDGQIIDEKKEVYPDKDRLKTDLKNKMPGVPKPAILRPVAS